MPSETWRRGARPVRGDSNIGRPAPSRGAAIAVARIAVTANRMFVEPSRSTAYLAADRVAGCHPCLIARTRDSSAMAPFLVVRASAWSRRRVGVRHRSLLRRAPPHWGGRSGYAWARETAHALAREAWVAVAGRGHTRARHPRIVRSSSRQRPSPARGQALTLDLDVWMTRVGLAPHPCVHHREYIDSGELTVAT